MTWQERVTPSGHWYWVPMMSARRTDESDCGSWQSPESQNQMGYQMVNGKRILRLGEQAKNWSSPQLSDAKGPNFSTPENGSGHSLASQVNYATPSSRDWRDGGASGLHAQESRSTHGKRRVSLRLNPAFVSQLMGFPEGWLDLDETS
jgi:hypothetical protein